MFAAGFMSAHGVKCVENEGGRGGNINRVGNVENVERGGDREPPPTVGAAVPCRPHGTGRGERGDRGEEGEILTV